jgi:hypothetical protein
MLIRKAAVAPLPARLENLLATYEKNLRLEVFFIRNKDTASLLEILPQQGDLIRAIEEILPTLDLPDATAAVLAKRLAEADALREANRMEVDRGVEELKNELQEMNAARVRIRQMRHISKTTYTQEEPAARLQDWA